MSHSYFLHLHPPPDNSSLCECVALLSCVCVSSRSDWGLKQPRSVVSLEVIFSDCNGSKKREEGKFVFPFMSLSLPKSSRQQTFRPFFFQRKNLAFTRPRALDNWKKIKTKSGNERENSTRNRHRVSTFLGSKIKWKFIYFDFFFCLISGRRNRLTGD